MRRFVAILVFAAFLLPLALPLLALGQDPEAGLPACCRRNGIHHCAMSPAERNSPAAASASDQDRPHWRAPVDRCPCCPASVVSVHPDHAAVFPVRSVAATFYADPLGLPQTECRWRLARYRARQKRGPPAFSIA